MKSNYEEHCRQPASDIESAIAISVLLVSAIPTFGLGGQ
jgi:hypothetical protein